MLVDVEKSKSGTDTQWLAESGIVDLFILLGREPQQVTILLHPQLRDISMSFICLHSLQITAQSLQTYTQVLLHFEEMSYWVESFT